MCTTVQYKNILYSTGVNYCTVLEYSLLYRCTYCTVLEYTVQVDISGCDVLYKPPSHSVETKVEDLTAVTADQ